MYIGVRLCTLQKGNNYDCIMKKDEVYRNGVVKSIWIMDRTISFISVKQELISTVCKLQASTQRHPKSHNILDYCSKCLAACMVSAEVILLPSLPSFPRRIHCELVSSGLGTEADCPKKQQARGKLGCKFSPTAASNQHKKGVHWEATRTVLRLKF